MKKVNNKSSVMLYERTLSSGKVQLYLKVSAAGKRVEESTGILILPDDSRKIAREKRMLAEEYRRKRESELQDFMLGIASHTDRLDDPFFEMFDNFASSKTAVTKESYANAKKHLMIYEPNQNITLRFITRDWVRGFKKYLLTEAVCNYKDKKGSLKQNTASTIFSKLVAFLNNLVKEDVLKVSPASKIGGIPITESTRSFLTQDELNKLYETPCKQDFLKRAFFFSCFTGLRFSDIKTLRWSDVIMTKDKTMVSVLTKKTKSVVYVEISSQAGEFLGEPNDGLVFEGLKSNSRTNDAIREWMKAADIKESITFHSARHTFATMLLTYGSDIYTVSKLLGHRKITTTQIYAKIIDEKKATALESLGNVLSKKVKK